MKLVFANLLFYLSLFIVAITFVLATAEGWWATAVGFEVAAARKLEAQ